MRKSVYGTVIALLLTAGLIYFAVNGGRGALSSDTVRLQLIRVWSREEEPAVGTWLKKMAAAYEKQTGVRVYLRKASLEETQRESGASRPDLLVLPEGEKIHVLPANRLVRLVFDGAAATEPIVASLAASQGILLNIVSADTHSLAGKTYGSMVLGLPRDETEAARALLYLREIRGVIAEEVTDLVC